MSSRARHQEDIALIVLLDTSVRQMEAQSLYLRLGFRQIPPYYELPEDLRNWLVCMERPLAT